MTELYTIQQPPVMITPVEGRLIRESSIAKLSDGGWIIVWNLT